MVLDLFMYMYMYLFLPNFEGPYLKAEVVEEVMGWLG